MPALAPAKLSPEERQRLRLEAAEKYMRGDMDVEEFEDQERQYRPDYRRVMQALVESQTRLAIFYAEVIKFVAIAVLESVEGFLADRRRRP